MDSFFTKRKLRQRIDELIDHTHIDVAWLWRLKHTREKAARSFTTVLSLCSISVTSADVLSF